MKPMQITVDVLDVSEDNPDYPPRCLTEFTEWLAKWTALVPEEHRADATINFYAVSDPYDGTDGNVRISYRRPETEQEARNREAAARRARERAEAEERRRLAELKAKYEAPREDN